MKHILFLLIQVYFSNFNFAQSNIEQPALEKDNSIKQACEICITQERLDQLENDLLQKRLDRTLQSQSQFDSLSKIKVRLIKQYDSKLEHFRTTQKYKSLFFSKDSAKAICTRSITFGPNLPVIRKNQIMDTLANEILGMRSGFTLKSKIYLARKIPKKNDKGELYVRDRMNLKKIIIIKDFEEWREKEMIEFDIWMTKINGLLVELHSKRFDQFNELEKIIFNNQLHKIMNQ